MSIASEISRLQTAKAGIKSTLEAQGVPVSASAKLDDYPELVAWPDLPLVRNFRHGYISGETFVFEEPTDSLCDIYAVKAEHKYAYNFGTLGSRMRVLFTTTDLRTASGTVSGINLRNSNTATNKQYYYTVPSGSDGFLVLQKTNQGDTSTTTYCYDVTDQGI